MKKIFTLLMVFCALSSMSIMAGDVVFTADFNDIEGTGGNDGQWGGSIAGKELAEYGSWTLEKAYKGDKCIKVGTGKAQGYITTPALTGLSGDATLTFNAGAWSTASEQTELLLEITGGGSLSVASVTMEKGAFSPFTVEITGGTASTKITFKGKQEANARFFLDEVVVTSGGGTGPILSSDATLKSLKVAGEEILDGDKTTYTYELAEGTTTVPSVTAEANHENAVVEEIELPTIAGILDGTNNKAVVTVLAENEITSKVYTVEFFIVEEIIGEVFFEETCGEEGATANPRPLPADYTDWDNQVTFSGNTDIRQTSTLSSHVWFAAYNANPSTGEPVEERELIIEGINTSLYKDIKLSYDVASNSASASTDAIFVYVKDMVSGASETLTVPAKAISKTNTYVDVKNLAGIPQTNNLHIRFYTTAESNPSGMGYRLDNIVLSGTKDGSSVGNINGSKTYVYSADNTICVVNAEANAVVTVYNIAGKLINRSTDTNITLPAKGMYIVKVNNQVFKVINK